MEIRRHLRSIAFTLCTIGLLFGTFVSQASAVHIDLEPPGPREFIRDQANLISPEDKEKIREICDKLLTDTATPIIVITIESMSKYGGEGMRIETFATLLFDQWGIGQATLNNQEWNTGILLLVSRDDHKARIELGGGWGRREDALCRQIMDEQIIPRFKQGEFSTGILAGVESLDKMARKLELPAAPVPWWQYAIWIGFFGLAIFTAVSLYRRGSSGWAWLFWGVVFTVIGAILYQMATSRGSGGGGGFSGGSFGGGSSGGGGATGSW
ncbi:MULTISPECIES: TPM domain-containing protein [Pirellulaceae]|nr:MULTISPECIES: TPM domain-containing protein [Pirellulaceae]